MDIEKNKAFTLIEMAVVMAVISMLSALLGPQFLSLVRRGNSVGAGQAMRQIRDECQSDYIFGSPGTFTPRRIPRYSLIGNCESASAIPRDEENNPQYSYDSETGLITCSYKNAESTGFPSCKKVAVAKEKPSLGEVAVITDVALNEVEEPETNGLDVDLLKLSDGNGDNTIISCDGKYVTSRGRGGYTERNNQYRQNIITGEKVLITSTKEGIPSTGDSQHIRGMSCDGRYALFTIDEYGSVDLDGLPGAITGEECDPRGQCEGPQPIYRKDLLTGDVVRVDTLSNGTKIQTKWGIRDASMSSDGRYVIFESPDVRFAGLPEAEWQSKDWSRTLMYRKDLLTGELSTVTTAPDGSTGTGWGSNGGYGMGMSDDGSKVTFIYKGDDLVEGVSGTNLYVKDFNTSKVSLVTADSQGNRLSDFGQYGSGSQISADGSKVIFTSRGSNGVAQLYMKDLSSGKLKVISQNSNGNSGNGYSHTGKFSGDGKYVVFQSSATNLTDTPTTGKSDIFVYDTSSNQVKRLFDESYEFDDHLRDPNITKEGKYITFRSSSKGITTGETQGQEVYMKKNPYFVE
ncbi:prepilin-type N-terminal cleavage/methylation domain-containing protein [Prochlorococcus marinus]|uniref:Uncharacterized protein n=1 Tax=Prochlorococcus marinus (strain MIT 9211) TaxID=93059 RepID=A9BC97_PROM4|nr:prepilin-type N-terminal cleavage/methylation domain-containing protein [Prochlorococcus marinus]ABX09459.1 Hypothetical protein P9211_15281 [Prochlorococcus marinus str. MIT 9211]